MVSRSNQVSNIVQGWILGARMNFSKTVAVQVHGYSVLKPGFEVTIWPSGRLIAPRKRSRNAADDIIRGLGFNASRLQCLGKNRSCKFCRIWLRTSFSSGHPPERFLIGLDLSFLQPSSRLTILILARKIYPFYILKSLGTTSGTQMRSSSKFCLP